MVEWLGLPTPASAHAAELDHMTALVHWLMLILFIGWGAFFTYTLVRFRRSRHPKADYHGVRAHYSTWAEVGVGIAEAVLLVGFAIPAWATRVEAFPPAHEAVVVRVVAEQFAWNVHYPGPDGEFGRTDLSLVAPDNPVGLDRRSPHGADDITTINQLVLPVDRPAIVHVTSKDVIHSFGLPNFRVKQDAIPGVSIPVWFTPTRVGDYEIACSQLCGLGHYRMRGFVTIQTQAEFEKWLAEQAPR
ncbi:MAG TPA: cytochrome c oxidase subunit II [Vicinamibacterales bacterium]|nr:cytochrome c oxidase subunit II [Vicinamibacterales bacterium]